MIRIARPAPLLAALLVAVFALAACGSDSGDSGYKKDAKAAVLAVRAVGDKLSTTMSGTPGQLDAAFTQQIDVIKTETDAALTQIKALKPSSDADKKLVTALITAFTKADTDIGKLADAATANDPTGAQAATEQLVTDSPAVKAATNALGVSVGVPPRAPATATTTTPASFPDSAASVVTAVDKLGGVVNGIIRGAGDQTDATLANQLADAERQTLAIIGQVKALQAPSAADQTLVEHLDTALQAIDGDLGSLSSAVAAHNGTASKAGTHQLLADEAAVVKANTALAKALKG